VKKLQKNPAQRSIITFSELISPDEVLSSHEMKQIKGGDGQNPPVLPPPPPTYATSTSCTIKIKP
jgi:hypothetical protein